VDENGDGVADSGDTLLLNHLAAQDALTGGLLHVAESVYYTRMREESQRYSRLKGIISPVAAYLGVVSTTFEVEYLDNVPFAVTPGGLLIDLKGLRINGSWEIDQPEVYSNETFKFLGHIGSSLEHEIWQEITGYDAISTMRGIQLAMASGEQLLDVNYNANVTPVTNTFPSAISSLGFSIGAEPAGFKRNQRSLFGKKLVTWSYNGAVANESFDMVFPDASSLQATDLRASWVNYNSANGLDAYVGSIDGLENQLIALQPSEGQLKTGVVRNVSGFTGITVINALVQSGSPAGFNLDSFTQLNGDTWQFVLSETSQHADGVYALTIEFVTSTLGVGTFIAQVDVSDDVTMTCNGTSFTAAPTPLLTNLQGCFDTTISQSNLTQFVDFVDINKGFNPSTHAYRANTIGINEYDTAFMKTLRSDMYFLLEAPTVWQQYQMPTRFSQGPNYLFNVYIKNTFSDPDIASSTYAIVNHSNRLVAGGGYVTAEDTVEPATSAEFNNEVFNNFNLVSVTNNDVVRTPSTVDPVSTVTGNMYHDETDIVISGRGLNYALTRTYNSDQTTTPNATNTPLSKGWTHSYNMRLIANDYGQNPNFTAAQAPENSNGTTSSITYIDERGGEANYLVDDVAATYAVTPPHMNFDSLQLDTPAVGQYTLTFRNGTQYIFSGGDLKIPGNTARLAQIQDAYGNELNFAYTGNNLTRITDNTGISGRTGLTLSYYTSGVNLNSINTITDWTGRVWRYTYNALGQLVGVVNPLGDSMAYTYDAGTDLLKDIIKPQDRGGVKNSMTFGYYENDQAYNYIDQLGNEESLTYDLFRKRTRITNPRGYITEHYYDTNGALIKLVEPDKAIKLFENNEDGLRYLKRDALGNTTTYSYNNARTLTGAATDTYGQVTREQDALGNTIDYTYGIYDQITDAKDKNNIRTLSEYYTTTDAATGALAGKLRRVVMPQATVNGVAQSNAVLAQYQYYADGTIKRIEELIDPATPTRKRIADITYAYDANGFTLNKVTSGATSGASSTVQQAYDNLWRLQSETVSRRASATDATQVSLTTSYEYDNLSRVVKITDSLGNISETVYDANGKVSRMITRFALKGVGDRAIHDSCTVDAAYPNHHTCITSISTYDAFDRLSTQANINGDLVTYKYDEMGNVTKITNARGQSLQNEYDKNGRLVKITNENDYSVKTQYDLAGRVVGVTDANGNTVRTQYNALGRATQITSPEGRVTRIDQYDGNGNVILSRDANAVAGTQPVNTQGGSVYNQYDEFNRLISETNANNEVTQYTYDLQGNLTSVMDPLNQLTQFIYDDMGRLIQVIDPIIEVPADKVSSFTYDELGNRLTATDRNGETVRTTYDRANRATLLEYLADGTTQTATYNQYNELVTIANDDVSYTYDYDNQQRMTRKTDSRTGRSLSWTYDVVGNVTSKTDYQGKLTQYTYDDTNRLVAMANADFLQASYHYDAAGRLLSRILSNGAATLYTYDKDGYLIKMAQRSASGSAIDERSYDHDSVGNITSISITGGTSTNYGYDPVYRLVTVDSSNDVQDLAYSYDGVGNRQTATFNFGSPTNLITLTFSYHYNNSGNRLDEVRDASGNILKSYVYDDNGSRIERRSSTDRLIGEYTYNQKRLMTEVSTVGTTTHTFAYDPNGYRIQRTYILGDRNYYLEGENLEAVYDEQDNLVSRYLRGVVVDEIINGFEKDSITGKLLNKNFHHDQVNSVIAETDHTGNVLTTRAYTPFGTSSGGTGNDAFSLGFTGRENDNSGLMYYRARYYDPSDGRFISEDPLGFEAGINFYAYVNNNPLNFNDPMGEDDFIFTPGNSIPRVEVTGSGRFSVPRFFVDLSGVVAPASLQAARIAGSGSMGAVQPAGVSNSFINQQANFMADVSLLGRNPASSISFTRVALGGLDALNGFNTDPAISQIVNEGMSGGLFDFKDQLNPNDLFMFNNQLETFDFITNVAWGAGMNQLGIGENTARLGSQGQSLFQERQLDRPGDQRAIIAGFGFNVTQPNFNMIDTPINVGPAGGGFVLYPNRRNTNMLQSVYRK